MGKRGGGEGNTYLRTGSESGVEGGERSSVCELIERGEFV